MEQYIMSQSNEPHGQAKENTQDTVGIGIFPGGQLNIAMFLQ